MQHFIVVLILLTIHCSALTTFASSLVTSSCGQCHHAEDNMIYGTLVPGSQADSSFKITSGSQVWKVHYDVNSELNGLSTVRDLRGEKGVSVDFRSEVDGWVYAEEVSYKPNYSFKNPDDIITINEVADLLKRSPKDGNYVLFDARGYDNYIEGHLPNAIVLPYYRLNAFRDALPADKNTLIVTYCRGYS